MQFRLIYKGRLPAEGRSGGHAKEKHEIRRQFHGQLAELWKTHPFLRTLFAPEGTLEHDKYREQLYNQYVRCGYRFVPLLGGFFDEVACSLDILFLRRDAPGNLVKSGGDIDNRIKTLLDGLKVPVDCGQVEKMPAQDGEDPFYCLLLDDSLITEIRITTDRLLTPIEDGEGLHDVHLIIHVKTVTTGRSAYSIFAG